jgi:hypothetical protein
MTKKVKTLSTNLGHESNTKQCQLTEHPLGVHVSELVQIGHVEQRPTRLEKWP